MKYSLKELRARNNLTQAEMAERLGVSRKRYIDIEKRPNRVLCETMVNVASVLGVDIGDIFLPTSITNSNVKDAGKEMTK